MNVRDLLADESDDVFARTSRRLAGLTNDGFVWEPGPHFPLRLGRPVSGRPSPQSEALSLPENQDRRQRSLPRPLPSRW